MEITYQGLRIKLPLEGVIQAEDFSLEAAFNCHARVSIRLLMAEEGIEDSIHRLSDGARIEVYEEAVLFIGKVIAAGMVQIKGLYYLNIEAVSYSCEWELEKVSQSFLNLDATYEQVIRKVLQNQPNADIKDCITNGAVIPDFLLQYEESDWDFLIRLASHFQSFLIPDYTAGYGRAYFGIPQGDREIALNEGEYQTIKDMDRYYRVNLDGELMTQEIMKWAVKTGQSFQLAQKIRFLDISTIVTKINYGIEDGQLCRRYELSREAGCLSIPLKNKEIYGMSIPATVKERSGNCVRVHFHVDPEYDSAANVKYFTYAIESSFIYCMPEVGSQVHIYFPSQDEKDAIAVHAMRMESSGSGQAGGSGGGSSGSGGGGGYAQNPDYKSFSNVNGAELLLTPTFVNAAAEQGKTTSIHLDAEGNAYITGKEIEIKSKTNLKIGEPAGDGGEIVKSVLLEAQNMISVLIGEDGETGIDLTEEAKVMATFVKLNASDRTPTSDPSAKEILADVTAGDADQRDQINKGASQQLQDKYEEGRAKILGGVAKILTTVATVAVVVGLTVATGGAAALAAPAIIGTLALGTTTTVFAAADIAEGVGDVQKGWSGDLSQSYNFLRDTLFMGNQTAYNIAKIANDIAFGVVSGKAMAGAFKAAADAGKIYKFACNSQQLKNLKTAIQVGGNVMNGVLNNLVYDGKVNFGDLLFNTGLGMIQGQIGSRLTEGILGRLGINGLSPTTLKALEAGVGTLVDTGMDAFMSYLLGKDFDLGESLAQNAFANVLAAFISDPVDAVTGCFFIHTTDFILASLPAALKLERSYRSTGSGGTAMGRGWTFTYDSRIYRDTKKADRIHLTTITGHALWYEKQDDQWIDQSRGANRFVLAVREDQRAYFLTDVVDHTVSSYDEQGRLTQVEYPNEQRLLLQYDDEGLSKIVTPLGNRLEVVSKNGRILQITDEIGRRTQYRYERDYLVDVIHTDEGITHYEYDEQGFIVSVTDQNGTRYLENQYDRNGRVIRQQFESGICQQFEYDDANRRNTVTFSETGKQEIYEYNKDLLHIRTIYQDGTCLTYEYSDQNLRTGQASRTGMKTSWQYDQFGRLIAETQPDGYQKYFEYDQNHDLIREWDTRIKETRYQYDQNHNRILVREKIKEGLWRESVFTYDRRGRKLSQQDGVGNLTTYQYKDNRTYPSLVITPKDERTKYQYDQVGRRLAIENSYGTVQMSYNSRNFVTKRTDGEGYTNRWMYDRMGNLIAYYPAKHWMNRERSYEYRYDFLERLIDTISPLNEHQKVFRNFDGDIINEIHPVAYQQNRDRGEGIRYQYDWDGNCVKVFYPDGGIERRFYDPEGHLIRQIMPEYYDEAKDDGFGYHYHYDSNGRLTEIIDPDDNLIRSFEYNCYGQVIRDVDGEGKEIYYQYNGLGQQTRQEQSIRSEAGTTYYRVISYHYDKQGNKIAEAYGNEEVLRGQEPTSWHRISFAYDANNHLVSVADQFGARMRYDYDCLGNLIMEEQVVEEGIKRLVRYRYNKNGWRICQEEELQGNGDICYAVTRYDHDENGNITRITLPKGGQIRRSYDLNDRLIEERTIDKKNGIDRSEYYTYDAAGNLIEKMIRGAGTECLKMTYEYDFKNRLTHQTSQSGAVTRYLYDQNDRLLKEIRPYGYQKERDDGLGTAYGYDRRGNRIKVTNGLNQLVEETHYNRQDQPIVRTDGLGGRTELSYTLDEQLKEIRRGTGAAQQVVQQYQYNARGQIIGIVDGNQERIAYDTDSWGRITALQFSDGVKEVYEYSPSGQITKAVDGNGHAAIYRFNSLGKVREWEDQLGEKETYQYDEEGNLILQIDRDGKQVFRTYNVFGYPVYEKATDENGQNPVITTYRYDGLGRLKQAVCDGHSYEYEYNEQGLLKEKRSSGKRLVSYGYDPAGQILWMKDPAGIVTRYEYDLLGRTSKIWSDQGMELQYRYDCLDRIEQIHYGNGVMTCYRYDQQGNLSGLETTLGDEQLLSYTYQYDGNGNRVAKIGEQRLAKEGNQKHEISYRYNIRGQLLEEQRNEDFFRYTYDAAGNRIEKESREGITSYSYNEKNQLIEETGIRGRHHFTYNKQGSIIKAEQPDGIRYYSYNSKNQQVKVVCPNGTIQENRYDAEGLRHEMKENEKLLRFVYHRGELLHETDASGQIGATSYHLGAGIEALQREQKSYYYHQDEQLSTSLITGAAGEVENSYQYDAFGNLLEKTEGIPNRILYTGQQYDSVTSQYYLRARYYNPVAGRFMQEDVHKGDGLNLYVYCGNNPVMYYDPSGYDGQSNGKDGCSHANFGDSDEESGNGYVVSDERRAHILEGDEGDPGSGHGPNRNSIDGAFPDTWTDDQVIAAIERIANNPNSVWHQKSGPGVGSDTIGGPNPNAPQLTNSGIPIKYELIERDHGLTILVAMEPSDRGIITGYVVNDERKK